jgi:hypothetical protein
VFAAERCAAWAAAQRGKPLAAEVLHHAKRAVIDWHAALYPGAVVPPATLLEESLAEELDHGTGLPRARQARHDPRCGAHQWHRGAHRRSRRHLPRRHLSPGRADDCGRARRFSAKKLSGAQFLRVSSWATRFPRASAQRWARPTTSTGTTPGRLAVLVLQPLVRNYWVWEKNNSRMRSATVATFAAALQQAFRMDSMSKPLHAGRAAEAGVTAALAAQAGVTGSLDCIEGFGRAMGDGPDWEKAFATLGRDFHITKMTFKNHACCGHTFAAIDGALELKKRIALEDIRGVKIGTYRAGLEVAHYEDPRTPARVASR